MQSEDWGPYRIEERLGSGGMGEVYRAYDSRLDRWVALKIIRPEAMAGRKARERFRREARSAAGLSHPTVLQIYDILEREEGDGIVMELVEGETLGRILKRGPMELDRVVRLAREIAEGLAAAHGRGIIHRDLKADNVMITPEDHPKILDFGLAKRVGLTEDQSISIEGRVVGTSHAMSPEQAQGFEVDHRTDLFSFGTLLYEMVCGTSPFRRPALAETLTRVCVHRQTPAKELRPEVPAELSDLIDELLRKKPEDRPQDAREAVLALRQMEPAVSATINPISYPTMVDMPRTTTGSMVSIPAAGAVADTSVTRTLPAADSSATWWYRTATFARRPVAWLSTVVVIAAAALLVVMLKTHSPPAITVAVPEPVLVAEAQIEDPTLLVSGLRVALNQGLLSLVGVTALAPDQVDSVPGTSQEIARGTAADEVLASRVVCTGLNCQVTVNRVGSSGDLLSAKTFPISSNDFLLAAQAAMKNVRELYAPYHWRTQSTELRVTEADYRRYLEVTEAQVRRDEGVTIESLLERIAKIRTDSPEFLPAYLLEADLARARYLESRDPADLDRAYQVIGQARKLAPEDLRPLLGLAGIALDAKDVDRAREALEELEGVAPGDDRLLSRKAYLLGLEGKPHEARLLMGRAYQRRPSWQNLYRLARVEYQQGAVASAREHLELLLDQYPAHFDARHLLGELELLNGEPERAVELFSDLVAESPGTLQLGNLGLAHMLAKQYPQAAEVARKAYELDPQSALLALNLADAEWLVGQTAAATDLYRRVLALAGEESHETDAQLLTVRAQAFAHLSQSREAVGAVQRALQLAPENPQVWFEAALVYVLVGERSSALASVDTALSLGVEPGWFRFPWFDPLREDPDFQAMIRAQEDPAGARVAGRDGASSTPSD